MISKSIKIFFFFITLVSYAIGQSPSDKISYSNFNKKLLEHLIKIKIDSVRVLHKLKPLVNDSILYLAASDHASYLNGKKILSHFQNENITKKTPQLRADYYGAVDYSVGENVALTYTNSPVKNKQGKIHINDTYEKTAFDFVDMWVHSPGHYANIITPGYQITGVAVSIDYNTNEVRAVQNFALVKWEYVFNESPTMFEYSNYVPPKVTSSFDEVSHVMHKGKHAWKLKTPDFTDEEILKCFQEIDSSTGIMKIDTIGRNILLYTDKVDLMYDILKKRKDGLAIEVMSYIPYDCGNPAYYEKPSRRNGQCVFSGTVLKPKYKKSLRKGFKPKYKLTFPEIVGGVTKTFFSKGKFSAKKLKIHSIIKNKPEADYFYARIAKLPKKFSGGYLECNLVVIKKKEVCRVMHFSNFCGEPLDMSKKISALGDLTDSTFELKPYSYHYNFTIPFKKDKFEYQYSDIKPFLDSLTKDSITVLKLKIFAQTSIEGTANINLALQEKRAESIVSALQKVQKQNISKDITTGDGWEMFLKQIAVNSSLDEFKNKSQTEIEKMFADPAICKKYESFLAIQRKADISMDIYKNITDSNRRYYLKHNYNRCIDSITKFSKKKIFPEKIIAYTDTLVKIQNYTYRYILKGKLDTSVLFELHIPTGCSYYKLRFNKLWMSDKLKQVGTNSKKSEYYKELTAISDCSKMYSVDSLFYKQILFNKTLFLIDNFEDLSYTGLSDDKRFYYINNLLESVNPSIGTDSTLINNYRALSLKFYTKVIDYLQPLKLNKSTKAIKAFCLGKIYNHYIEDSLLNDTMALKLAKFFIYEENMEYAFLTIMPYVNVENPNHEILILYLKMIYENYEEYPQSNYSALLIDASEYLNDREWCEMFIGPCNISFQVFDYEPLRKLYCKKNAGYRNYAKDY
jgi:uncharacterized protein YkwD